MTPNSCPMVTRVPYPLQVACTRRPPLCIRTTHMCSSMHTYHTHVLLYAYVPHTFAPLCLRTTYVPHTYHVLVSSTSTLAFSTRCKDKCTCHPIETSAHAFSICTCCPLKNLRLVRFPNLPAPNLRERLFFTKDPKGASVLVHQAQMQEENCKMHKFGGGKGQEKTHRQKDQS